MAEESTTDVDDVTTPPANPSAQAAQPASETAAGKAPSAADLTTSPAAAGSDALDGSWLTPAVGAETEAPQEATARDATSDSGETVEVQGGIHELGFELDEDGLPKITTFKEWKLDKRILRALDDMGYERPMPVQEGVYKTLTNGKDMMVQSKTGSGKTSAFAIPIAQMLSQGNKGVQALVLAPTRELGLQVAKEFAKLTTHLDVAVVPVYGGAPIGPQIKKLQDGAQIVAGTPGRVLDHIRRKTLDTSGIRMLVLDECDEMLSMGFQEEIENIISTLPAKEERQTLLFSATIPKEIERIGRRHMREPEMLSLSSDSVGAELIDHYYYVVSGMARTRDLLKLMKAERPESAIIFCNTREETNSVARYLRRHGYDSEALSSDLSQSDRERVMQRMRDKNLNFLVATDIAARGIDISELSHVINYTFPASPEVYVHRSGRTGRAGKEGTALSLVGPREIGAFYYLKLIYKIIPTERELPSADALATIEEGEQYQKIVGRMGDRQAKSEFQSLAKRLWQSAEGERVVALLLQDLLSESKTAGSSSIEALESRSESRGEAPGESRRDRPRNDEGEGRGRRPSRDRDERGRRGRRRDRDEEEVQPPQETSELIAVQKDSSIADSSEEQDDGRRRRRRRRRDDSEMEAKDTEAAQGQGTGSFTEQQANADSTSEDSTSEDSTSEDSTSEEVALETEASSGLPERSMAASDADTDDSDSEEDLSSANDDEAGEASEEDEVRARGEDKESARRRPRRRRRRRGKDSNEDQEVLHPEDADAGEESGDSEDAHTSNDSDDSEDDEEESLSGSRGRSRSRRSRKKDEPAKEVQESDAWSENDASDELAPNEVETKDPGSKDDSDGQEERPRRKRRRRRDLHSADGDKSDSSEPDPESVRAAASAAKPKSKANKRRARKPRSDAGAHAEFWQAWAENKGSSSSDDDDDDDLDDNESLASSEDTSEAQRDDEERDEGGRKRRRRRRSRRTSRDRSDSESEVRADSDADDDNGDSRENSEASDNGAGKGSSNGSDSNGSDSDGSEDESSDSSPSVRLFVNVGKREDADVEEIRSFLAEALGERAEGLGRITLRNTHCYVRVDEDIADEVIEQCTGLVFHDREMVVERAKR